MQFDLNKLEQDFFVDFSDKDKTLNICPRESSDTVNTFINEIGAYLGLDEYETDTIRGEVHKIHIMSVLRRCSRW